MVTLTHDEQEWVTKVKAETAGARRFNRVRLGVIVGLLGIALIVVPDVLDLMHGALGWTELRKTVGFALIVIAFLGSQWSFARYAHTAGNVISKLVQSADVTKLE